MTKLNQVLLAALVLQSALALFTRWPSSGPPEARDLLGVKVDDIQLIRITGRTARDETPEAPVELARADSGWVIRSKDDYPVAEAMMTPLLETLGKFKAQTPIATQAATQTSLEVADTAFIRKLEVEAKDGTKKTLYIGTGQGKSAAVRAEGEEEVFSVRGVTAWNIADVANRYFERDLLTVDPATLSDVTVERPGQPPAVFRKSPEGVWTLDGLAEGQVLDQGKAASAVGKLVSLRMADPATNQVKPEMGLDPGVATVVRWTGTNEGQSVSGSYRIGAPIPDKLNRYYVQLDGNPWVVEVLKANLEQALVHDPRLLLDNGLGAPVDVPASPHGSGGPHGPGGPGRPPGPHGGGSPHGGGGKAPGHP